MTESMLLALAGGGMGVVLGEAALLLLKLLAPPAVPHLHDTQLDLRVTAFAVGITVLTGILFGLAPAFDATRMDVVDALKGGGRRPRAAIAAPRAPNIHRRREEFNIAFVCLSVYCGGRISFRRRLCA